jgi:hypothetical protein
VLTRIPPNTSNCSSERLHQPSLHCRKMIPHFLTHCHQMAVPSFLLLPVLRQALGLTVALTGISLNPEHLCTSYSLEAPAFPILCPALCDSSTFLLFLCVNQYIMCRSLGATETSGCLCSFLLSPFIYISQHK